MDDLDTLDSLLKQYTDGKDYLSYFFLVPIILYIRLSRTRIMRGLKRKNGTPDPKKAGQAFSSNMRSINAICRANDIVFISALQPFNGMGRRIMTKHDTTIIRTLQGEKVASNTSRFDFILEYYDEICKNMSNEPYFQDLTGVFDKEEGQIFFDTVHFSNKGQKIVADQLCALIQEWCDK